MKRLSTVCLMFALVISACGSGHPSPQMKPGGSGGATVSGSGGSTAGSGGTTAGSGGNTSSNGGTGGGSGGASVVADGGSDEIARPDSADAPVAADSGGRPPNADCPQGALICDDFEGYPLGGDLSPNWTTEIIKGNVQVETSKPYRGSQSVHLTVTLSPANEPVRTNGGPLRAATLIKTGAPLFPAPGNAFWGRAMVWVAKMPPSGSMGEVHSSHVEASGSLPNGQLVKYGEGIMGGQLLAGYTVRPSNEFDLPLVDCGPKSGPGIPEGRWVCMEWQIDGAKSQMHWWFDSKLQTQVDVNGPQGGSCTWKAPIFDKLFLGWRHSQPSPIDIDMWMDDVVIDTKRVNCPPMQ
ncbi:MAG TPA: hypothetical protein VH374_07020 [Polyangia bacterium]|jgi:hypothetical protein|nr:hypothetical protein [Polyangia bacterium]